jgi:tetratricopeptide (TPR) repeat protein
MKILPRRNSLFNCKITRLPDYQITQFTKSIRGHRMKRMKKVAFAVALLAMGMPCSFTQNKPSPASQNAPTGQTSSQTPQKRPPQAKTQAEWDAYKAIIGMNDPAAQEKAANDFVAKYPESELRALVYRATMNGYRQANNLEKMMEMGQKVLSYDPDDPQALVGVAQVLTDQTRDTDLDHDQKFAEARKDAQRALVTVDTDVPTGSYPADQINAFKSLLRSDAYEILGSLDYKAKAWTEAEGNLKKSIDAYPQQVDPTAVLLLTLALDQENRYPEALKYANQAVDLTKEGTTSGDAARREKERLTQLTSGANPAQK